MTGGQVTVGQSDGSRDVTRRHDVHFFPVLLLSPLITTGEGKKKTPPAIGAFQLIIFVRELYNFNSKKKER